MKETAAGGVGSIFGFQHFFVHDLEAFKAHLGAMVTEDRHRCWCAKGRRITTHPTGACYEILRQLGVHPVRGSRASAANGPSGGGAEDAKTEETWMCYTQFTFSLKRLRRNCARLLVGAAPYRGGGLPAKINVDDWWPAKVNV